MSAKLISLTRVTVRLVVQTTRAAVPSSGARTSMRQVSLNSTKAGSAKAAQAAHPLQAYRC